jgi:PST family polysaccharide transporter
MMNEQAEVALLLAGPGVAATLTFAPLVINIFYSTKFGPTVELLRWNCFGLLLQVATWPLATLQLAQGKAWLFFWTQSAANAGYVLLTWAGIKLWGLNGAAAGFCGMIVIQAILSCVVARKLSGFEWAPINLRLGFLFASVVGVVFLSGYILSFWVATAVGLLVSAVTGLYSLRLIAKLAPMERMPRAVQKVIGVIAGR